jgi:polyketide cyclase/dehydrase/lipid transport protein
MQRSDTQAISIDAPPSAVIDLLTDAAEFPRWAAGFARAVRADGDHWIADTGEGEVRLRVRVSREFGTVDFLLADALPAREIGAFSRVVPNGRGSELVFTQFFADDMRDADLADQRAIVAIELQTVRALCERAAAPDVIGATGPRC